MCRTWTIFSPLCWRWQQKNIFCSFRFIELSLCIPLCLKFTVFSTRTFGVCERERSGYVLAVMEGESSGESRASKMEFESSSICLPLEAKRKEVRITSVWAALSFGVPVGLWTLYVPRQDHLCEKALRDTAVPTSSCDSAFVLRRTSTCELLFVDLPGVNKNWKLSWSRGCLKRGLCPERLQSYCFIISIQSKLSKFGKMVLFHWGSFFFQTNNGWNHYNIHCG